MELAAKFSHANNDYEVLTFKDFQGPLTSDSHNFQGPTPFSRTFQILKKWLIFFKDFQGPVATLD